MSKPKFTLSELLFSSIIVAVMFTGISYFSFWAYENLNEKYFNFSENESYKFGMNFLVLTVFFLGLQIIVYWDPFNLDSEEIQKEQFNGKGVLILNLDSHKTKQSLDAEIKRILSEYKKEV